MFHAYLRNKIIAYRRKSITPMYRDYHIYMKIIAFVNILNTFSNNNRSAGWAATKRGRTRES